MRFWRIKLWWHAYVMGRRVFYMEGEGADPGTTSYRVMTICDRSSAVEVGREWREFLSEIPTVTREVIR